MLFRASIYLKALRHIERKGIHHALLSMIFTTDTCGGRMESRIYDFFLSIRKLKSFPQANLLIAHKELSGAAKTC